MFTAVNNQVAIELEYLRRTPTSANIMASAARLMPGGVTRGFGSHLPYPVVMDHGRGCYLWDVDGNRYVDLISNGLALIHGNAYQPVIDVLIDQLPKAWAWLGTSAHLVECARILCDRLATFERVLFTNSGTESSMLAVKLVRSFTGKPLILKARAGYHGSYSDLEAGLEERGEIPGHTLLAEFNDLDSFERKLIQHEGQVAAVLVEPVMYTGVVVIPENDFLRKLEALAREHGALFVLDDCLMLRLAYGGSAEKFGLTPDITFLGKFLGGGTAFGAVGGRADILEVTNPFLPGTIYHGGSYNGNVLGSRAAKVTLQHLTQERIADMDARMIALRDALRSKAASLGLAVTLRQIGSIMGIYFTDQPLRAGTAPNPEVALNFHLACANHGVHLGPGGVLALSTAIDDHALGLVIDGMEHALQDIAA